MRAVAGTITATVAAATAIACASCSTPPTNLTVTIGQRETITAELASSDEQRRTGLSRAPRGDARDRDVLPVR